MSAIQNRQPPGRPTGGRYAATEHAAPGVALTADPLARFPHPDRGYAHPMSMWPAEVEHPASVGLGTADVDTTPAHVRDPQLETTAGFPTATVTMPNGATVECRLLPGDDSSVTWAGDWEVYAPEGGELRDDIGDVVLEFACQARSGR